MIKRYFTTIAFLLILSCASKTRQRSEINKNSVELADDGSAVSKYGEFQILSGLNDYIHNRFQSAFGVAEFRGDTNYTGANILLSGLPKGSYNVSLPVLE